MSINSSEFAFCKLNLQDDCVLHFLIPQVYHFFDYQSLIVYNHCLLFLFDYLFY